MIQHRNYLGRDIKIGRMRLFHNPEIFPVEPYELFVRLGRLHLIHDTPNRHPTLHPSKPKRNIPNNATIRASTCRIVDRDLQSTDHWQRQPTTRHQNTRQSTYVFHARFASMASAVISFPSNRNTVSFNRCHSMTPIVSGTPLEPLQRYLVIVVTFLSPVGVEMV